jgi:HipA-like C-terminal domain
VFAAQLLFWLLAAVDGHAKNFSLRLLPGSRYHLTPLYDVLSTWPIIGDGPRQLSWHKAKLAMAVWATNRHDLLKTVARRHFNAMAPVCLQGPSGPRASMDPNSRGQRSIAYGPFLRIIRPPAGGPCAKSPRPEYRLGTVVGSSSSAILR